MLKFRFFSLLLLASLLSACTFQSSSKPLSEPVKKELIFSYQTGDWKSLDEMVEVPINFPSEDFIDRYRETHSNPVAVELEVLLSGQTDIARLDASWELAAQRRENSLYYITTRDERYHTLWRDGKEIMQFEAFWPTASPLLGFVVNEEGRWVLMRHGYLWGIDYILLHNWENVNEKYGFEEVFELRELQGQLFYFFKKDGKIWWKRGDQVQMTDFDAIWHDGCCSYAAFNVGFRDDFFLLYALQDSKREVWKVSLE